MSNLRQISSHSQRPKNRLRPIPVLGIGIGIGIGLIPAVSGGIGYRRYCSRYRPIPVGRRCNDKMPKYHVDRLISLPAAMAANGSPQLNAQSAMCDYVVHGLLHWPPTTTRQPSVGRAPTSKVPRNSPYSAYTELDAVRPHTSDIQTLRPDVVTVTERAAARDVWMPHCSIRTCPQVCHQSARPRWRSVRSVRRIFTLPAW